MESVPAPSQGAWRAVTRPQPLNERQVHVYRLRLDRARSDERLPGLSAHERARALALRRAPQKNRFITARAALRALMAFYLRRDPRELVFTYGERGKPLLEAGGGIEFNLSHSGDLALLAFTRAGVVGVDLERRHRAGLRYEAIARRFFSGREGRELFSLPAHEREEAFFRCWVIKEAFLKAEGSGLHRPLDEFDVAFLPGEPPRIRRLPLAAGAAAGWRIEVLHPHPGYVGAVAVRSQHCELSCYQLHDTFPDDS